MRFLHGYRILLTLNVGMTRSDALNKNDSKRQAIQITVLLSEEEKGERYQLAAAQILH